MKIFLVGGAVRDTLLGYPFSERDWVVTGANPDELLAKGFTPVGKDFPVFLHPQTREEYALARTERKTGHGYGGFSFNTAPDIRLEDDLARRDLTINAIAQDDTGQLIDPYNGAADIKARLLRHVSSAFSEDPVRVLRVARFAARYHHLGFTVADDTMQLMRNMVASGETDHLVPERVWKELVRALGERNPEVFIEVLRETGALARILPEIDALFGVPQRAEHHPEIDTGIHTLMVLQQACILSEATETPRATRIRFAALLHDLGKGTTPETEWPRHIGHETRSLPLIKALAERIAVPRDYRDLALMVAEFHTHCHRALELKATTLLKLFKQTDALRRPERFAEFLLTCEADARGRTGFEKRDYPQAAYLAGALDCARKVDVQALVATGYAGIDLGHEIDRERQKRLTDYKESYTS